MSIDFMRKRLEALKTKLVESGLDAFLVTDIRNIRYLSGFTGSSAYLAVGRTSACLLTDSRYTLQAEEETRGSGIRLKIYKRRGLEEAARRLSSFVCSRVSSRARPSNAGFEGNVLSFDDFTRLKKSVKGAKLKSLPGIVRTLRRSKDVEEIKTIREAARILDAGFAAAKRTLRPGISEGHVASIIEAAFKRNGAEGPAFETIVASGMRSALPHGRAGDKLLEKGEFVVIDCGALLQGYNTDETRTFFVGRPGRLHKKVYQAVLDGQTRAIEKIRPGVRASRIDMAARGAISAAGFGKYFVHSTGHGVGLDVHEPPVIGPKSKDVLEEGMVITVEPGIYIPGWGGVRIEDMALVTRSGFELLTNSPRGLGLFD
ncbi:MAG: aminopeptidase P family protein [Deltaproteobacteria bacterium]|nr:aminopeptidase P family protein [Deltaproteobacteria bacterium]